MTEPDMNHRAVDYGERGHVRIVADAEALAVAAADQLAKVAADAASEGRAACIALSGGSTPKRMGQLLAASPYAERIEWARLHVFWGDERWVPIGDPESNAGEAKRGFLDRVPIPADQIHPFVTDLDDPEHAAKQYEATIRAIVSIENDVPRFDLVFLGMGDDGHTASLFPGTAAIHERKRLAVANPVPKLDATRLSLTPPVLNAAKSVTFLVGGSGKAEMLHSVLDGPLDIGATPSQAIRPLNNGSLVWIVDRAAATRLDRASGRG